ncbi:MAG: sucrase ferredoxin [Acidimicrobiia bacterium]|nr:sucrase ferredoxin [Acidimicrobiia bacterium]
MTVDQFRCSEEAIARAEPIFATASVVSAWLLIEQPGAWGPDALMESKFPRDIGAELQRRAGGVRILLIRHRTRSRTDLRFFKAHSGGAMSEPAVVEVPLEDPADLLGVDFGGLANGDVGAGVTVDHPIYLVCTHGRHDICCADKGRPLYRTMSELRPDETWEVSHLGGDRFAGNMLVLPRGDYFGRVEPEDAASLVAAYEEGRLDVEHHRGRSIQPRLLQAAEHFIRTAEGLDEFGALTTVAYRRPEHDRAEAVFAHGGGTIRVEVMAHQLPALSLMTCRAERQRHQVAYELVSVSHD